MQKWDCTANANTFRAIACNSGFLLPTCRIRTIQLSVNHLNIYQFNNFSVTACRTNHTADSSCHVELCPASWQVHCPNDTQSPCLTTYPPYPVSLASVYTTLTAEGVYQIGWEVYSSRLLSVFRATFHHPNALTCRLFYPYCGRKYPQQF